MCRRASSATQVTLVSCLAIKTANPRKRSLDAVHRGRAQGEADLLDIGAQGGGQSGWNRGPLRFAPVGFVGMQLAWRDVGDAELEERRFGAEQRGGQRAHAVRVRPMAAETGD